MCLSRILICAVALYLAAINPTIGQTRIKTALVKGTHEVFAAGRVDLNLQSPQEDEKSVALAVIYSVLLPGIGHLYAGSFSTGRYYLVAETGLWLTYAGFRTHGQWLREDARTFASQHANAVLDGKDNQFEVNIGNFNSIEEFNEAKLRNRQYSQLYEPGTTFAWRWDSDANRLAYKDLRIRSDEVFRNSQFVIGALVLNRIIAAFSAARATAAHNRAIQLGGSWRVDVKATGGPIAADGIELALRKEF